MTVSEKMARCLGVAVGLAVTVAAWPAAAAPKWTRLSLTDASDTTMTVTWHTDGDVGGEVKYGTAPGNLTETASGTSAKGPGALGYIHEVTLTKLKPNTTYYYQAGDAVEGMTPESSFTTGPVPHPECGTFRFLFLGDNRPDPIFGGGENYSQILAQADKHQVRLILAGGDLVIDGDKLDQWQTFLGYTTPTAVKTPFMPCLGNHDTGPGSGDGANYNRLFALPRSMGPHGSNTEDYYAFTYGNAVFIALSTESFKGGAIPFQDQADYVDEVLTQYPMKWKIVYYHKPSYTYTNALGVSHEPNEEKQNAALVPVFDKHHVDIVLTSHNHWYERYEPSACGTQNKGGSDKTCGVGDPAFGTVYLVSGGAGAFTIPAFLCGMGSGQLKCSADHHYILFDVKDGTLNMETWAAFPQQNKVIDSLVIQKPVSGECTGQGGGGAGGGGVGGGGTGGSSSSSSGNGGSGATGGTQATGGSSSTGAGGSAVTPPPSDTDIDSGCGCRLPGGDDPRPAWPLALLAMLGLCRARRRR